MSKPLIIIGAGDHAKVLLDILLAQGEKVIGLADKTVPKGTVIYCVPVIGDDDAVLRYKPDEVELVNGLGSVKSLDLRKKIFCFFKEKGYKFRTVMHKSSAVSCRAVLYEGAQVLAGAVINTEAKIGEDTIINTGASVDHGCVVGKHVHIAPGCTLSGCVTVGSESHVGTGSSVIQGIKIGSHALIGAGSVVVKDVADNATVYGVPAKMINTINMTGGGRKVKHIFFRGRFITNQFRGGMYA